MSFSVFAQENVLTSTYSTVSEDYDSQTTPLYYEFYYTPDFFELPQIDYEDVTIPYLHYISPDLEKIKLDNNSFVDKISLVEKNFHFIIGNNYILDNNIKFISPYYDLVSKINFENLKVVCFDSREMFKQFNYFLKYSKPFNNWFINFQTENNINYLNEFLNIYRVKTDIKRFIKNKFEISYCGNMLYIKNKYDKIFKLNEVNTNILLSNKILTEVGVKLIDNNELLYTLDFVSKEILPKFSTEMKMSYDNLNKNMHYIFSFIQNIQNSNFGFFYVDDIDYDYLINEYFTTLPYFEINTITSFYYPEKKSIGCFLDYLKNNFNLKFKVGATNYKKYPTYFYKDYKVYPFYIENISFYDLNLHIGFKIYGINFILSNNLLFADEEILFKPKIYSNLDVHFNITKNIYLSTKILYNDKIKVDFDNTCIESSLIIDTILKYNIFDNLNLSIALSFPLVGKNYFLPYSFFESSISGGIEFKF